jgi:hypothetical protein
MAIEHAAVQVARKPWGVRDLHPNGYSGTKGAQLRNASLQVAPNELPGSSPGSHGGR